MAIAKVYDSFLEKDITEYPEKLIVSKEMPKERWLVAMFMSFGGLVKVIPPNFLQNNILEHCPYTLDCIYTDNGTEYKGTKDHALVLVM